MQIIWPAIALLVIANLSCTSEMKKDSARAECGTDEILSQNGIVPDIDARSKDCAKISTSTVTHLNSKTGQKITWNLVARRRNSSTGKFHEVWRDPLSKKLWTSPLDEKSDQNSADAKCSGPEGKRAAAGISGPAFGLPAKRDFDSALENGLVAFIPDPGGWFWTSTTFPDTPYYAWESDGRSSGEYVSRDYLRSVICVSR